MSQTDKIIFLPRGLSPQAFCLCSGHSIEGDATQWASRAQDGLQHAYPGLTTGPITGLYKDGLEIPMHGVHNRYREHGGIHQAGGSV